MKRRKAVWLFFLDGRVDAVFVVRRDARSEAFAFMRQYPELVWREDPSRALRWYSSAGARMVVSIERRMLRYSRLA